MIKKRLGRTTIEVSPVGMGCMGLTHASGDPLPKEEGIRIIREAYDMGYTFFDTAENYLGTYADGTTAYNEEYVGEALKEIRNKVTIASKFGVRINKDRSLTFDSRPEVIRRSIEGTLKRLQTDHVDLYYQHRIDGKTPVEEVAGVMADLIKEGKILSWGISETKEDYLRKAHAICPVTAIQNRYSMLARWHEDMFPVVEELGITYVAFSPMANGFLSGAYAQGYQFEGAADYRGAMPQFTDEGRARAQALMDLLQKLSVEKNATLSQLSMAWMMCKKPYIIPIPGSRKISRLRENLGAADITLTADEVASIDILLKQSEFLVFGGHAGK